MVEDAMNILLSKSLVLKMTAPSERIQKNELVFCAVRLTQVVHVKRIVLYCRICYAFWGEKHFRDHVVAASKIVCDLCSITSSSRGHREKAGWLNPSSTDKVSVLLQGTSKLVVRSSLRTLFAIIYTRRRNVTIENTYTHKSKHFLLLLALCSEPLFTIASSNHSFSMYVRARKLSFQHDKRRLHWGLFNFIQLHAN